MFRPYDLDDKYNSSPKSEDSIMDDERLLGLPCHQLNQLLRNYDKDEAKRLKQRRRTLKNRGYASSCRNRRFTQRNILEQQRDDLQKEVTELTEFNKKQEEELNNLRETLKMFEDYANKIMSNKATPVKSENHQI